jgi:hypothetical protein
VQFLLLLWFIMICLLGSLLLADFSLVQELDLNPEDQFAFSSIRRLMGCKLGGAIGGAMVAVEL